MDIDARKPGSYYINALSVRPRSRFDLQDADELLLLVLRQHPVTQIPWVATALLLFILTIVGNVFLPSFITLSARIFLNLMLFVFIVNYIWLKFMLYYYHVGVITNKRILDVDFYSILYRETSQTRVYKVEDVTAKTGGYFGSLFNYGNVFVQTAGTEPNIEFINIPAPSFVAKVINDVHAHV